MYESDIKNNNVINRDLRIYGNGAGKLFVINNKDNKKEKYTIKNLKELQDYIKHPIKKVFIKAIKKKGEKQQITKLTEDEINKILARFIYLNSLTKNKTESQKQAILNNLVPSVVIGKNADNSIMVGIPWTEFWGDKDQIEAPQQLPLNEINKLKEEIKNLNRSIIKKKSSILQGEIDTPESEFYTASEDAPALQSKELLKRQKEELLKRKNEPKRVVRIVGRPPKKDDEPTPEEQKDIPPPPTEERKKQLIEQGILWTEATRKKGDEILNYINKKINKIAPELPLNKELSAFVKKEPEAVDDVFKNVYDIYKDNALFKKIKKNEKIEDILVNISNATDPRKKAIGKEIIQTIKGKLSEKMGGLFWGDGYNNMDNGLGLYDYQINEICKQLGLYNFNYLGAYSFDEFKNKISS